MNFVSFCSFSINWKAEKSSIIACERVTHYIYIELPGTAIAACGCISTDFRLKLDDVRANRVLGVDEIFCLYCEYFLALL